MSCVIGVLEISSKGVYRSGSNTPVETFLLASLSFLSPNIFVKKPFNIVLLGLFSLWSVLSFFDSLYSVSKSFGLRNMCHVNQLVPKKRNDPMTRGLSVGVGVKFLRGDWVVNGENLMEWRWRWGKMGGRGIILLIDMCLG